MLVTDGEIISCHQHQVPAYPCHRHQCSRNETDPLELIESCVSSWTRIRIFTSQGISCSISCKSFPQWIKPSWFRPRSSSLNHFSNMNSVKIKSKELSWRYFLFLQTNWNGGLVNDRARTSSEKVVAIPYCGWILFVEKRSKKTDQLKYVCTLIRLIRSVDPWDDV